MGAFKQFLSTDVTVVPFVVNKSFSFVGSASFASSNIERLLGSNIDPSSSLSANIFITSSISSSQLYNSIKQLYYTNYIPTPSQSQAFQIYDYRGAIVEDSTTTATNARFFNYEQTSLFQTRSANYTSNYGFERFFPTESGAQIGILSIPKNLFGDYIKYTSHSIGKSDILPTDRYGFILDKSTNALTSNIDPQTYNLILSLGYKF